MSKIYPEILAPERQSVFERLVSFQDDGYLAGGTALALQIRHRRSYDFDIFVPQTITSQFKRKVREVLGDNLELRLDTGDLLLVKLENEIEVHFVHYWFERLEGKVTTASISVASVADIAADKAHTIGRRAAWRDYVDLFFLLKRKAFSLEEIINLAEEKFTGDFARHLFLEQVAYFDDLTIEPIEFLQEEYRPEEIQAFLMKEAEDYTRQKLSLD